jgi:hypothetical protein
MKTIIAGDRNYQNYDEMKLILDTYHKTTPITEVISGGARGADSMGEWWAKQNDIKIVLFPAMWNKYGLAAGPIRNKLMAEYGEGLIAFLASKSRGTKNMIEQATKLNLKIKVVNIN